MEVELISENIWSELKKRDLNFGEALRFIRQKQGLTIRGVAREVEKTPTYISDIERGNNKPPEKELMRKLIAALSLQENEVEIQNYLFDLAAKERGGVPEDIVDYIMKNSELRMAIRLAQKQKKDKGVWGDCLKRLQ